MVDVTPATDIYNEDVLRSVPAHAQKILEVGTGSGTLAREIRKKIPHVAYVGVEISEEYAERGQAYCDRMYVENFESASGELLRELQNVDVLIFADVLEHFVNPWAVLKRVHGWMRPGSQIIACIPNVQHWSVQYRILMGDFRYADTGLLDRTHLRFFTRQTMVELFESTGYVVESVAPRIFDFPGQAAMLQHISTTAQLHGLDPQPCVQDAAAFQFVITACVR